MRGESATSNPWVAKGERTQMIKAAIVGPGLVGSIIIHRAFSSGAQCLTVGAPITLSLGRGHTAPRRL